MTTFLSHLSPALYNSSSGICPACSNPPGRWVGVATSLKSCRAHRSLNPEDLGLLCMENHSPQVPSTPTRKFYKCRGQTKGAWWKPTISVLKREHSKKREREHSIAWKIISNVIITQGIIQTKVGALSAWGLDCSGQLKKTHNLKVENYILFSGHSKDLSPEHNVSDSSGSLLWRDKGGDRIYRSFCKKD